MNFSLILPSRERLSLLENLLNSVKENTFDLEKIEIWVAIDWDDFNTLSNIRRLCKKFDFVQFIIGDRQDNLSVGYYNKLGKLSTGKFIQVLNDDCELKTKHWDKLGLEVLEEYQKRHPDGILLGKVKSTDNHGYSCFPVLSKIAVNLVGWVQHPEFSGWGSDIHLDEIYSKVGRIVDLPYFIEHISHHTGMRERDNINMNLSTISKYNYASAEGESHRLRNIISAINGKKIFI